MKEKIFFALAAIPFLLTSCGKKTENHAEHDMKNMNQTSTESLAAPASIGLETVLVPVNESVAANLAVVKPTQSAQSMSIRAEGFISYDPNRINNISVRFSGRIQRLYIRYNYQMIREGERLMEVYSPEISTAEDQLLQILKNDANNHSLIKTAREKLLLLGLDERSIERVIQQGHSDPLISVYSPYSGHAHAMNEEMMKGTQESENLTAIPDFNLREGMYIEKGQPLLSVYNTDEAWGIIRVDAQYALLLKKGLAITISSVGTDQKMKVTADYIEPLLGSESKFVTIRSYLSSRMDNMEIAAPQFKIGELISASIELNDVPGLWLPSEAVFHIGSSDLVWLKNQNFFTAHQIQTGLRNEGIIQVLSGLTPDDSVAANAGLLSDNDSFIHSKN